MALDVHHRLREAVADQGIAEVVHVDEAVHVHVGVSRGPGPAQLDQGVGPIGGERQQPAGLQHTPALCEDPVRIVAPVNRQVADDQVDARVPQRQRTRVGADAIEAPEQALTPGFSYSVACKDQAEIDCYWDKLLEGGKPMACGWLTDKFGLCWQIVPENIGELLKHPKAMAAMMNMVKFDVATLEAAAKE